MAPIRDQGESSETGTSTIAKQRDDFIVRLRARQISKILHDKKKKTEEFESRIVFFFFKEKKLPITLDEIKSKAHINNKIVNIYIL